MGLSSLENTAENLISGESKIYKTEKGRIYTDTSRQRLFFVLSVIYFFLSPRANQFRYIIPEEEGGGETIANGLLVLSVT